MQTPEFEKPDPPQGRIPGVFESNFNFLDSGQNRINDLRSLIQKHLVSFLAVINDSSPEKIAELPMAYHSWFHVTTKGGYFRAHTHPRANASMFLDPTNRAMRRELSFNSFKITPRSGDLLIFPSFITHFVEPYQGELPRVTVAANFWATS